MKILIAPDKFKGSLSANEVCEAIALGFKKKSSAVEFIFHPMADGGEGSLDIIANHLALQKETIQTKDPLGRSISATYFTSKDAAFIEVATASGMTLLKKPERNPLLTSTWGTGRIIRDALLKGYQNIYLFLGGSATNDAGMGIAQALGFDFLDANHEVVLPIGKNLSKVKTIKDQSLFDFSNIQITLFCDVTNPLFGSNGAAYVYAPQKGANSQQVQELDRGLEHFSKILQQHTGLNPGNIPGSGAAGGIPAGLLALCNAKMGKGFEIISTLTGLEKKIKEADCVISGEGRLDHQSLQGKVIDGVAGLCRKHKKPLTLLVGKNDLNEEELFSLKVDRIFSVMNIAKDADDAMSNGAHYLAELAQNLSW